jgi:hypothetical protein
MDPEDWFGTEYETPESQSYVGLSLKDALEAAIGFALEMYRLIDDLHNAISCDPRPDRLSLWVVGGVVSRPAFF